MWQTLATGVGTNPPERREQGEAILVSEMMDNIWDLVNYAHTLPGTK
jgi:hypothetical protein